MSCASWVDVSTASEGSRLLEVAVEGVEGQHEQFMEDNKTETETLVSQEANHHIESPAVHRKPGTSSTLETTVENEDETFLAKDYSLMLLDARKPQDLRVVLDGVCIPSEDALSPEQSVIRGIVRDELVLQHSALCEKLLGLIGSKSEQAFRRFQAADLLSWLLQDSSNAFARFCNDYTLGNCITRLIKDAELEVSWAGMRLLRNISKYNMPFGMEFVMMLQEISKKHDPQIAVYVCEIVTALIGHTHFDQYGSMAGHFMDIYNETVEVVLALLRATLLSSEDQDFVLGKVVVALKALSCPDLYKRLIESDYSSGLGCVWSCLQKRFPSAIHDFALDFVGGLVDSSSGSNLYDSTSVHNLAHLLQGGATNREVKVLKVIVALQSASPRVFLQYTQDFKRDLLTRLHLLLTSESGAHQRECMVVLHGLLNEEVDFSDYRSSSPAIVSSLVAQLSWEELQTQALTALDLLLSCEDKNEEGRNQALQAGIASKLLDLLPSNHHNQSAVVLRLLTALSTSKGRQDLCEVGSIGALIECLKSSNHSRDLVPSCLATMIGDDPISLEEAINSRLHEVLCAYIVEKGVPIDVAYLLDRVLKSKKAIEELQSFDGGVVLSLMNHTCGLVVERDFLIAVLSCVATLVENQIDSTFEFTNRDNCYLCNLLQSEDIDLKVLVIRIIYARMGDFLAGGEYLSQSISHMCPPTLEWHDHPDLVQKILRILSSGVAEWPELFPKALVSIPSLTDRLWSMADKEQGYDLQFNLQDVIRILRNVRQFERAGTYGLCLGQSAHQNTISAVDQVVEVVECSAGVDKRNEVPSLSSNYIAVGAVPITDDMASTVEELKRELLAKEDALQIAQMDLKKQAEDIEVLMECINQQHDRLEKLSMAVG